MFRLFSLLIFTLIQLPGMAQDRTSTGGERQQEFYSRLHFPYGVLSPQQNMKMHQRVQEMAEDAQARRDDTASDWIQDEPFGVKLGSADKYYSGRIRDLEVTPMGEILRIGAASGGLWEREPDGSWTCLSDQITSLAIGSFDTNPLNDDVIVVGTGESSIRTGTGIWRTNNRGLSWEQITTDPFITSARTLRFNPLDSNIIHLAAAQGYFKSVDGGRTFTRQFDMAMDDLAIDPQNPDRIYACVRDVGLYRSTSGGDSLSWELINGPWDPALFGRSMVAVCKADPSILYMAVTKRTDWRTEGVYTSVDTGTTWTACAVTNPDGSVAEYHWGQGWYNNLMEVHPLDCQIAYTAGGSTWQTLDGYEFNQVNGGHADNHRMTWKPDGSEGWLANDGGLFRTTSGFSWDNDGMENLLPIRQFTSFAISAMDNRIKGGGSQDNGVAISPNYTENYLMNLGGDGGDVVFSRFAPEIVYATTGVYGGDLSFRRHVSFSQGLLWLDRNNGINPCTQWWCENGTNDEGTIFTHCGGEIYQSGDDGLNWSKINAGAPGFAYEIWEMTVGYGTPAHLYACMHSSSANKLMVLDRNFGTWESRGGGLPTDTYVKTVTPSYTEPDMAFAVMGGVPASGDLGRKVYRTDDGGDNWNNITANLPNVPLTDLVVHPKDNDKLYVCGDITCFMTENGGNSWVEWGAGFPAHILITEMDISDSLDINGHLWIYGASYGRSVWKRLLDEGPPPPPPSGWTGLVSGQFEVFPNPSAGQIIVQCDACGASDMKFELYSSAGQLLEVRLLSREKNQVLQFENLHAGIYTGLITGSGKKFRAQIVVVR